jgi:putative transposase
MVFIMQRRIIANGIYHVYSRGNQQMVIYKDGRDYEKFLTKMSFYLSNLPIEIHAYCLMPNHFHLLIRESSDSEKVGFPFISIFMSRLLSAYAKYFCAKYKHSGHVFQGRFNSLLVDKPDYLKTLIYYIHDNPVRKSIVEKAIDWPYSSAHLSTP